MTRRLASLAVLCCACSTVGPGRGGVLWKASSGTQNEVYGEGLYVIAPWNEMNVFDLRSMNRNEKLSVIAVNGLEMQLDASVRYHIIHDELVALEREIGPNYYEIILAPVLRSEARRVIGRYTPEELYSTKRDIIEREIREELRGKIAGRHIDLEAVLIRNIELPESIRDAIDKKLAAEQEVLKMKYVLDIARSTAEEKRIQAQGVADYNRAITASLSQQILDFERIQQIGRLAESGNSKTVVIGPGGAPVMLTQPASSSSDKR